MIENRIIAFITTLLLSQLAHSKDYWNHSEQQGNVGACHSFATIALVEAEYWKATGKHINLSEKDLFVRHFTKGHSSIHSFLSKELRSSTKEKLPAHHLEAGYIEEDFKIIKKHGVASERDLPYKPVFRSGVSMSLHHIRYQRDLLANEASILKSTNLWDKPKAQERLQHYLSKLNAAKVPQALQPATETKTSLLTRQFIKSYTLRKIAPKTTPQAKQLIIQQVQHHPVALDITNYAEISGAPNPLHTKHSLVVSHYNPQTDQFTVRSSTFKGEAKVSADTLSRGTYHLYFLEKT